MKQVIENQWILDASYGAGIALGFRGDQKFIDQSINFCYNYGAVGANARVHGDMDSGFVYVVTTMDRFTHALELEGEVRKQRDLIGSDYSQETRDEMAKQAAEQHKETIMQTLHKEDFLKYVKTRENNV